MKQLAIFALTMIACVLAPPAKAGTQSDAEIKKSLLGIWRSPRHEFEFKPNGKIYLLPTPNNTTNEWSVKNGVFYWDKDACDIVTLTDKRFVYKYQSDKGKGPAYILNRITAKMVGQPYNRESVK